MKKSICVYMWFRTYFKLSSVINEQSFIWHRLPILVYRSKLIKVVQYTDIIIDIWVIGMSIGPKMG